MTDDRKKLTDPKTFSFTNYADEFDTHISKSIRGYADLRTDVVGISKYFVAASTQVLDIGCSEGTLIEQIARTNEHIVPVDYYGVEINPAFKEGWSKREREYRTYSADGGETKDPPMSSIHDRWLKGIGGDEVGNQSWVTLQCCDVLEWLEYKGNPRSCLHLITPNNLSLVVSLFTMQFLPERHRLPLFKQIYDHMTDGGAFIISEKIFAQNAKVQDMLDSLYYEFKTKSFSEKEIMDKEKELRHLAHLTTENLLITQLRNVGFRGIQIFWRNFNFIGVLAMKRPSVELEEE